MNSLFIFVLLVVLMLTGMPISIALGLTVLSFLFTMTDVPVQAVALKLFTGIEKFEIMAIPFFILAGNFLTHGGVARRMIEFATSMVGHWHGGLALSGVLACALFAAVSGSSPATVVSRSGRSSGEAARMLAELREAVDFCRYYAQQGRAGFAAPLVLPGPTGETNELTLHGRGVFACISPWNFPLAIFIGQVAAALVAGNSVIAKPAEQTPLIAARATSLLLEAGVPPKVMHLLPGEGALVGDQGTAGVRV